MKKITLLLTLAFLGLSNANAQVGIGTTNPDASAALDVDVSSLPANGKKGFLPPRLTRINRDAISNPATGLMVFNTSEKCLDFYGGYGWTSICADVEPGEVLNPQTGRIWMDKNLGANQVAQSYNDPAAYGDLYQWGRAADDHQKIFRVTGDDPTSGTYTTEETGSDGVGNFNSPGGAWDGQFITRSSGANNWVDPSVPGVDNLWQGVGGTNNPCPAGFRLPTEAELFTETQTWNPGNRDGAFASPLKMTAAGRRGTTATGPTDSGFNGNYWTSTIAGQKARYLLFAASSTPFLDQDRAFGASVRCIKEQDTPPAQTGSSFSDGYEENGTCSTELVSVTPCSFVAGANINNDTNTGIGTEYDWTAAEDYMSGGTSRALVEINGQCWFARNSINPSTVPIADDPNTGSNVWGAITVNDEGYWGYYNTVDNTSWGTTEPAPGEGLRYQWSAAMNDETAERSQGVCPDGWHIPSDCEWMYLENNLGMDTDAQQQGTEWREEGDVGTKLSTLTNNGNGTNASGFTALLSGQRGGNGVFAARGTQSWFWSSTENPADGNVWTRRLDDVETGVYRFPYSKNRAMAVRCLKD